MREIKKEILSNVDELINLIDELIAKSDTVMFKTLVMHSLNDKRSRIEHLIDELSC